MEKIRTTIQYQTGIHPLEGVVSRDRDGEGLKTTNIFFSVWPYRMVRVLIAAVFLWSGMAKLFDPASFAVIIEAFGLIPESWIMPLAVGFPVLEILVAVGLLVDVRGSLAVILGLLVFFMVILLYGINMGLDIDCGCFGPKDPEGKAFHSLRPALYRDIAMVTGVVYLYFWRYCRSAAPVRLSRILNENFSTRF